MVAAWLEALTTGTGLIFLVAVLTAFTIARSTIAQRRAESRYPPRGQFVDVDGVRTHVVRKGTGPPLLFLHGLNGFIQDWLDPIATELARDHEVIAIDRPGYGHSTRPRQTLSDPRLQADWLDRLYDVLDLDAAVVVAHSWGGGLAMTLAVRHPERVRGLVLVAPYVYPGTNPDDVFHMLPRLPFLRTVIAQLGLVPVGRLIGRFFIRRSFDPEPVPEGYSDLWHALSLRKDHFDTTIEELRTVDPALHTVLPDYPGVDVPLVILAGEGDRSVDPDRNAKRLHAELPHSMLLAMEDKGHMLPYTASATIVDAVREVVARATKDR